MYSDYAKGLAREYIDIVYSMDLRMWTTDEYSELADRRSVIHEQLLQELGETRQTVPDMRMKAMCILREV